jgi:hypothetical protein
MISLYSLCAAIAKGLHTFENGFSMVDRTGEGGKALRACIPGIEHSHNWESYIAKYSALSGLLWLHFQWQPDSSIRVIDAFDLGLSLQ